MVADIIDLVGKAAVEIVVRIVAEKTGIVSEISCK